jgi:SAM-dependent methyltransferase
VAASQASEARISSSDLVRYSVALGRRALLSRGRRAGGLWSAAAWRIWMPVDVDRVVELPWTGAAVEPGPGRRILDVSSPKLLACWLAEHTGAEVVATDVWSAEVESWLRLTAAADRDGHRFRNLHLEPADARDLPYEDASFDAAYATSVIEHVEGDGDGAMMTELERVVRPGGLVALTFPFRPKFELEYVHHDLYGQRYVGTEIFFQRHYDSAAVRDRLLAGRAFEVVERGIWRKEGVREAQGRLRRVVPERWEVGRLLGPVLPIIGARALSEGDPDNPGPDNVMRLLLRRV